MARPPTDLGPNAEGMILSRMAKGDSPEKVHAYLVANGIADVGVRTIARRMASLRPEVNAARAKTAKAVAAPPATGAGPPLPATPDEIPADASLALLEHYRRMAKAAVDAASDEGDLKLVAQLINMAGAVEDRIQKRTPRVAEDPNDDVDMVKLGAEVEARFLKMVDMVLEER